MTSISDIDHLAQQGAKRLARIKKSANKGKLSEADQLKQYNDRVASGGQYFKDLVDKGQYKNLADYIRAMSALQAKSTRQGGKL